jgi:hypothetical protein
LTQPDKKDTKVITVDGGPAVSTSSLGGVALSAADLDRMKARLDELRKNLGGAPAKPPAVGPTPVVAPAADGTFADILRQRHSGGSGASSSSSGMNPPGAGAAPANPPPLPPPLSAPTMDARSLAAELAKVLGLKREGPFGDEETFWDSTSTRAAYLRFAEKNAGRIAFKELANMMESLFTSGTPATVSGPIVGQFFSRVWLPQHPMKESDAAFREMRTLSSALDLLITGKVPEATDMLMSRFMSCQRRILDGDDRVAKFFELIPIDRRGSSTRDETNEYVENMQASAAKRARVLGEGAVR